MVERMSSEAVEKARGAHGGKAGTVYGYARVSTADQNLARQMDALEAFPVAKENVFCDKTSGRDFDRPGWRRAKERLREGDVLVVTSIDRMGRNYREILDEWRDVTCAKRADVVVLDMPLLDTRNSTNGVTGQLISDIVLQLLSYVAQVERENIKRRQAEGIAAAKCRGVSFGRPRIAKPVAFDRIMRDFRAGGMTRAQAAKELGVSPSTFDRWRKETERIAQMA